MPHSVTADAYINPTYTVVNEKAKTISKHSTDHHTPFRIAIMRILTTVDPIAQMTVFRNISCIKVFRVTPHLTAGVNSLNYHSRQTRVIIHK